MSWRALETGSQSVQLTTKSLYLDVIAVSREVHLHDKAGDVSAAVDAVQLRAKRQVIEVNGTLGGADSQVSRIWTKPREVIWNKIPHFWNQNFDVFLAYPKDKSSENNVVHRIIT